MKTLQEKTKDKSTRSLKLHKRKDLKVLLKEVRDLTTALCKSPYLRNTLLACGIQFGLTSSYYTLMVWFPELFTRYIYCIHILRIFSSFSFKDIHGQNNNLSLWTKEIKFSFEFRSYFRILTGGPCPHLAPDRQRYPLHYDSM